MNTDKVDIVIPWVDNTDPSWQAEFDRFAKEGAQGDSREIRYRDWGLLRYWFRAIDQFMPWVDRIHFVTSGHIPEWLDLSDKRLNWVKHEDFIPTEYLPTFSANTIELNLHRIKGLSDRFIYFNDDIFVLRPLSEKRFFRKGLPCDFGVMTAKPSDGGIIHMAINDLDVIDRHFDKRRQMRKFFPKWFSPRYGVGVINNLLLSPWRDFSGFIDPHLPNAFLKSTLEEVWKSEPEIMDKTCRSRFRTDADVNQWLFRYWQLAQGNFCPSNTRRNTVCMDINDTTITEIKQLIGSRQLDMICLNDSSDISDFNTIQNSIQESFEKLLPQKSPFEK